MQPTTPQSGGAPGAATGAASGAIDWEGGTIDELVQLLAGPALAVRVEVRTPAAGKPRKLGEIHMVAGGIYETLAGELRGDAALEQLRAAHPVSFRLQPRLPNPDDGGLQIPGPSEGTLAERPAAELMRYCELYVLTCTVELWRDTDRAQIEYRKGEIVRTMVNGDSSETRLPEVMSWQSGGYRILLAELKLPAPARAPAPVPRTPAPVTTAAASHAARPAAQPAPQAAAQPAPQAAAQPAPQAAAQPAPQAAPQRAAPARTIFGMPAAVLPATTTAARTAAGPASGQPSTAASQDASTGASPEATPARSTASGMRVDVYDPTSPERTTNLGVTAPEPPRPAAPQAQEEAAPRSAQPELTTLPGREPPPEVRAAADDRAAATAQSKPQQPVQNQPAQRQQAQKKKAKQTPTAGTKAAARATDKRPAVTAGKQPAPRPAGKGEMSIGAYIGIGVLLGLAVAAVYWIIQIAKG